MPIFSIAKLKLENVQLKKEIKKLRKEVTRDHLTKLFNSMALSGFLQEQVSFAKRYKLPLSIIFIDFDNLKKYNDSYGHLQGNEAIRTIAKVMKSSLRTSDILGRWTSGEEFLVILPETKKIGAAIVAEKMRHNVERARVKKATKDKLKPGYDRITISLGVSELISSEKVMLKQADEAVYKAKHLGRNRVELS